jgi:Metallo-peptidase family M12B Reprolysin-like
MKFLLVLLPLLASSFACAQTTFFTIWPGHPSFSPLPPSGTIGVEVEYPITVNVRALVTSSSVRQQFSLRMPNGTSKVFTSRSFDGKEGFVSLGASDIQPDPALPDSALSYFWYGTSGNETFTVSVYRGRVSASLIASGKNYAITRYRNQLVFRQFNPALVPNDARLHGPATSLDKVLKDQAIHAAEQKAVNAPEFFDAINVLVLHTPAALVAAGDQAQLNAVIAEAFGQSDITLSNSGVTSYRLKNVATGTNLSTLIANYDENPPSPPGCNLGSLCRWVGHRVFLRTDTNVQAFRNAAGADLVVMIVADEQDTTGVAYIQKFNCGFDPDIELTLGCDIGAAYNNFAVSAVSLPFITSFQVFAHETGHQLGMEHNAANANAVASFPWSYGWFVSGVNETVMSIAGAVAGCAPACPRALHYSNPNVNFIGTSTPSGTSLAWNARTGAALAPATSELLNPVLTGLIFRSGFESLPIR